MADQHVQICLTVQFVNIFFKEFNIYIVFDCSSLVICNFETRISRSIFTLNLMIRQGYQMQNFFKLKENLQFSPLCPYKEIYFLFNFKTLIDSFFKVLCHLHYIQFRASSKTALFQMISQNTSIIGQYQELTSNICPNKEIPPTPK